MMHKSRTTTTFVFLASTLVMLAVIPFLNNNRAMAQGYYDDSYSTYPTDDKKYECRTGPFEGFFVGSVEFCDAKHKFDDRKDHDRDNKTGAQGPPGPSTINTTNVYRNFGETNERIFTRDFGSSVAFCDDGDTALSGSFVVGQIGVPDPPGSLPAIPLLISSEPLADFTGWNVTVFGINSGNGFVTADVECFDNPPPHIP